MAFNTKNSRKLQPATVTSPIRTDTIASGVTGNKHPGYARDPKSELFLLAVSSLFGQDKFYEKAQQGSDRFVGLVQQVTRDDPEWMLNFIGWLRNDANIRSAAVVASVESARALVQHSKDVGKVRPTAGVKGLPRLLAQAGLSRGDEVGEALAYYTGKYGRKLPKPLKRGLADRLLKLNEYSVARYDTASKGYRLADLLNLLHPVPTTLAQADLFGWVVASAYGDTPVPETLPMLRAREFMLKLPVARRREHLTPELLKAAGMSWESVAGWLQGPMDKAAWEALAPTMGYMALLRNLRNFDQAGVSDKVAEAVAARLCDPAQVARSMQFPFRFLSAHRNAPSLRWGHALSKALDLSLANIPKLDGRTLVLVDVSSSMNESFSDEGKVKRWDAASIFGIALAKANPGTDLWAYSGGGGWVTTSAGNVKRFDVLNGAPVLAEAKRWADTGYNMGGGTPTAAALRTLYKDHDRVILLTDEQANQDHVEVSQSMRADRPLYTFNLAGYKMGHAPGVANRHTFGGLTDVCFKLIASIESGASGTWPWESTR